MIFILPTVLGYPSLANERYNPNVNAEGGSSPPLDVEVKLPPTILFMTECNNPNEMLSLLPTYCYPRSPLEVDSLLIQ